MVFFTFEAVDMGIPWWPDGPNATRCVFARVRGFTTPGHGLTIIHPNEAGTLQDVFEDMRGRKRNPQSNSDGLQPNLGIWLDAARVSVRRSPSCIEQFSPG